MAHTEEGRALWRDAVSKLVRNRAALISAYVLLIICLLCILLPMCGDFLLDPNSQDLTHKNEAPSSMHWCGTDHLGRDIFSRLIYGGRISIAVGFLTTIVAVCIGVTWGAVAGYVGNKTDAAMMRSVDVLYALPFLVVVILLRAVLENQITNLTEGITHLLVPKNASVDAINQMRTNVEPICSLVPLFIAIGLLSWLTISRIVRAQVIRVKNMEYIEAARSLGLTHATILFRHILPNCIGPVIVYATLTIPSVMLLEAVLSFLGLGVKPPNSSWGVLIEEGANRMLSNPYLLIFPASIFAVTLLSLNFLGDGLRDAIDRD